jgi:hypothetical protein
MLYSALILEYEIKTKFHSQNYLPTFFFNLTYEIKIQNGFFSFWSTSMIFFEFNNMCD